MKSLSHVGFFATPWTVPYQAPLTMGFSRQECWSGLLFPSPGDLPHPGIEPRSPALQADPLPSEPPIKKGVGRFEILSIQRINSCLLIFAQSQSWYITLIEHNLVIGLTILILRFFKRVVITFIKRIRSL